MTRRRPVVRAVVEFLQTESAAGQLLMASAAVALVWANVAPGSYHDLWNTHLTLPGPDHALTLHEWVADALMAVFFFVVGLEIKREIVDGELRDPRTALVPVLAAIGGMTLPALVFLALTVGTGHTKGWGIPMATDIAFAVGVLRLASRRAPAGIGLTLLTLAIVDDLGAIAVIALFYSEGLSLGWLAIAGILTVFILAVGRHLESPLWYVIPALVLWIAVLRSGVHATVAGVVLGFLTPVRTRKTKTPVAERLEHLLHPWSSFVILPLFALANAGISLSGSAFSAAASSRAALGIFCGLVVGKLVGITAGAWIATRLGGRLPDGVSGRGLFAIGLLGGIGFTVSLFVADLSFTGQTLETAKLAVLMASVVMALSAATALRTIPAGAPAPT